MSTNYKGMRWLKCDLQMQTPADSQHWQGKPLTEGQETAAAKEFASACYDKELDVVGITDHNFLSKDFIPLLQQEFKEIEQEHNHKITLFPGFEFEAAGVGRGVHVLCLFDPKEDLEILSTILTECGVSHPKINKDNRLEKSDKNLKEILCIVQDAHDGIIIMPHATSNKGIFDNDAISEWLQQDQFTNPKLLAIEVTEPVHLMSEAFQRLLRSGKDCQSGWRRIRPIATIMSSDNKKLVEVDEEGKPTPNSIGYRYSWIKMSEPSIESLRQAFLDHESRIILPENVTTDTHPSQRTRQAIIKSVSIKNVDFLADQEVHFSSNMNCIIGGRGSGKSTLLEYLRIVLGKSKLEDLDERTEEQIERVQGTLNKTTEIKVCWVSADGVEDHILWQNERSTVQSFDLHDPDTFFDSLPIRFYSQQQINRLTESKTNDGSVRQAQRLLELVDGFIKNELDELMDKEHKLKQELQDAFSNLHKSGILEKRYKQLQQEYQDLDRRWNARKEIEEDVRRHQLLKAEARYLEKLDGIPGERFTDVAALAQKIAASHVSFQAEGQPHEIWFKQFDEKVKAEKNSLAKTICDAVKQFEETVHNFKTSDPEWNTVQKELEQADVKFSEACSSKGLTTDDVGRIQEISQLRTHKQREIDEITTEIQQIKEVTGDTERLMQQLHEIWEEQFQKRKEAAVRANDLAVLNESKHRFIKVSVKYQQDYEHFRELWQKFAAFDGRTRLGRQWESIGKNIYNYFVKNEDAKSPWQILENPLLASQKSVGSEFKQNSEELFQYIENNLESWEKLHCSRVRDIVDIKLFRTDGSTAGSIAEGSLSDGQRNTAVLALLLAQEGGPLVIDQPEDELDSNFMFRELIPMLRKVKSKRQLIMATHNANLPVNGDAELVYALEVQDGKGKMRACGGLDQTPVTEAILDIMEGTEEAFRRRREKYHF